MTSFLIGATLLVLLALAFVLPPLWRSSRGTALAMLLGQFAASLPVLRSGAVDGPQQAFADLAEEDLLGQWGGAGEF